MKKNCKEILLKVKEFYMKCLKVHGVREREGKVA